MHTIQRFEEENSWRLTKSNAHDDLRTDIKAPRYAARGKKTTTEGDMSLSASIWLKDVFNSASRGRKKYSWPQGVKKRRKMGLLGLLGSHSTLQ